jgi:uncharacterized protein
MTSLLYLHGFASSPSSDKPTALRALLTREGIAVHAPDLNVPAFETLDFEAMVATGVAAARADPPAAVVGSSLGAAVALEVARRGIDAPLVLIAPAIGIADLWISRLPAGDPIIVANHARGEDAPIHRAFFEQMHHYSGDREAPRVPVVVFMGTEDESIPFDRVRTVWNRWQESGLPERSEFVAIDGGDHRLVGVIDRVAAAVRRLVD